MSDPFIGEIRLFGFNFAPTGWAQCNGQLLPIAQNTALFSLLGTTYGGDGRTTFGLPDLQARRRCTRARDRDCPIGNSARAAAKPSVTLKPARCRLTHVVAASSTTATSPTRPITSGPPAQAGAVRTSTPRAQAAR